MRPIFPSIALASLLAAGCQRHAEAPTLSHAQLDAVERGITYCTVATAALGAVADPRRGQEIRDAATVARARCASAQASIAAAVRVSPPLAECLKDVQAQQHIAEIRLESATEATTQTRSALVAALDEAAKRHGACSANLARANAAG
jgi:hypothetical protein